jgi:hypothetical protein
MHIQYKYWVTGYKRHYFKSLIRLYRVSTNVEIGTLSVKSAVEFSIDFRFASFIYFSNSEENNPHTYKL